MYCSAALKCCRPT